MEEVSLIRGLVRVSAPFYAAPTSCNEFQRLSLLFLWHVMDFLCFTWFIMGSWTSLFPPFFFSAPLLSVLFKQVLARWVKENLERCRRRAGVLRLNSIVLPSWVCFFFHVFFRRTVSKNVAISDKKTSERRPFGLINEKLNLTEPFLD